MSRILARVLYLFTNLFIFQPSGKDGSHGLSHAFPNRTQGKSEFFFWRWCLRLHNQEVAEFPSLESWFLTILLYDFPGASLPPFGRRRMNGDRKLKLGILLPYVGDPVSKLPMAPLQEFVRWHFTEGEKVIDTLWHKSTRDGVEGRPPSLLHSQPALGKQFCKLYFPCGWCDGILLPSLFWTGFESLVPAEAGSGNTQSRKKRMKIFFH